ncbi:MAG TPA: bifunctional phosphoribosyl-AMP cyclohydrolase/phosphoribosyl-ATP diphosphatase HisIE [Gemmatimonadaceae bacterium]|nr:bifunctional phosphoribosyl-AMP cyclohydrolase/phosphoribosyl-ATP diphosphatase HisIE [Gemmatimonadaceae bacterium]
MLDLSGLDYDKNGGLVTVVTQDAASGMVLMVAHADRAAVERTLASGEMHYFSRTRGPWHKGATSGNTQRVVSLACDCDGDVLLARVVPNGPACHTGSISCFVGPESMGDALSALDATIAGRAAAAAVDNAHAPHLPKAKDARAAQSYTVQLLEDRNLRLKKLGEEAAELIAACADGDLPRATEEVADLLYHALVALRAAGGSLSDVQRVLAKRATPAMPPRSEARRDDAKSKKKH